MQKKVGRRLNILNFYRMTKTINFWHKATEPCLVQVGALNKWASYPDTRIGNFLGVCMFSSHTYFGVEEYILTILLKIIGSRDVQL